MDYEVVGGSKNLRKDDIVVAIMGPTGSGKSRIVDILTGRSDKGAGSGLESHTSEASAVRIKNHSVYKDRIVLLDTPGFDDTRKTDLEILQIIAQWLMDAYKLHVTLAGVLYLHRITDNRMAGAPHRNLQMFGSLCGDKAARGVVLVTTMWDKLKSKEVGEAREEDLKTNFWAPMIANDASIRRFENTPESALAIIDNLVAQRREGVVLLLQEELVDLERTLKETKAGQALYQSLQLLLIRQKGVVEALAKQAKEQKDSSQAAEYNEQYREIQNQLEQVVDEINSLHVSFGRKILMFFGKKSTARTLNLGRF